ncbi:hypothetical protein RRG08_036375 [Elysia crispata]|uniref:Uncharacterized protein n=1 Tax=Elysia crispata TaxID=231223 RepID=A0AAE1DIL4_9GAST|nr:hypothetical protein RRG08_036375 [Elysia crispata]
MQTATLFNMAIEVRDNITTVPGTRGFQQVKRVGDYVFKARNFACFYDGSRLGKHGLCSYMEYVDTYTVIKFKNSEVDMLDTAFLDEPDSNQKQSHYQQLLSKNRRSLLPEHLPSSTSDTDSESLAKYATYFDENLQQGLSKEPSAQQLPQALLSNLSLDISALFDPGFLQKQVQAKLQKQSYKCKQKSF